MYTVRNGAILPPAMSLAHCRLPRCTTPFGSQAFGCLGAMPLTHLWGHLGVLLCGALVGLALALGPGLAHRGPRTPFAATRFAAQLRPTALRPPALAGRPAPLDAQGPRLRRFARGPSHAPQAHAPGKHRPVPARVPSFSSTATQSRGAWGVVGITAVLTAVVVIRCQRMGLRASDSSACGGWAMAAARAAALPGAAGLCASTRPSRPRGWYGGAAAWGPSHARRRVSRRAGPTEPGADDSPRHEVVTEIAAIAASLQRFIGAVCRAKDDESRGFHRLVLAVPRTRRLGFDAEFSAAVVEGDQHVPSPDMKGTFLWREVVKAVGPPLQKAAPARDKPRGFGQRASPALLPAPKEWGPDERRTWSEAHTGLMPFLCALPAGLAKVGIPAQHVHVVLPELIVGDADFLDLQMKQLMTSRASPGALQSASKDLPGLHALPLEKLHDFSAKLHNIEQRVMVRLLSAGCSSALRRYVRFARRPVPGGVPGAVPQDPWFHYHSLASLPSSGDDLRSTHVLFVVVLGPGGAVDRDALAAQVADAMFAFRECRSFALIGTARSEDTVVVQGMEVDEVLDAVAAEAHAEAERRGWVLAAYEALRQTATQQLLSAAAALEEGACDAEACRAARAEALQLLGDEPPSPDVSAAQRRVDAALGLTATVRAAVETPDVAAWRSALPEWEAVLAEAQAVGCPGSCVLRGLAEEAIANAVMAVDLDDRVSAVLAHAASAEDVGALRDVLAAAEAAPPPVGAALSVPMAAAAAAVEAAAQEVAQEAERESAGVMRGAPCGSQCLLWCAVWWCVSAAAWSSQRWQGQGQGHEGVQLCSSIFWGTFHRTLCHIRNVEFCRLIPPVQWVAATSGLWILQCSTPPLLYGGAKR